MDELQPLLQLAKTDIHGALYLAIKTKMFLPFFEALSSEQRSEINPNIL